ncbi:MAG: HD domain-containing protein [Gemmatimonadales bacterium]
MMEPGRAETAVAPGEPFAALDVGSNSIRLVVAVYDPATGIRIMDEVKEQPRLAVGLAATGLLDDAAMERAYQTLRRMRAVCERRGVHRLAAVATAAVRDAANGEAFCRMVRDELGIPLRIISEEAEAALTYRSVDHHFSLAGGRTIVADIGGGSLELTGAVDGLVEQAISTPFGAVRVTEQFLDDGRKPFKQIRRIRNTVRRQLRRAMPGREWTRAQVIGSGGTFTNLGRMAAARRDKKLPPEVHGITIPVAEVEQLLDRLAHMTVEERARIPGLNPQRADIIVGGLAVTAAVLDWVEAREVTISAFGLREGLLLEMAGVGEAIQVSEPLRLIKEFVERCHVDLEHAEHVRVLSLDLFNQLQDELGAGSDERRLLEAAALLHDVGQMMSYRKHHKHSYRLIMHGERLDLPPRDRALVALVARYHRRKGPRNRHAAFSALGKDEQAVVHRLAGLLRIADGLDRGHSQAVSGVTVITDRKRVLISAKPREPGADNTLEVWSAGKKADVLAGYMNRDVVVEEEEPIANSQ